MRLQRTAEPSPLKASAQIRYLDGYRIEIVERVPEWSIEVPGSGEGAT